MCRIFRSGISSLIILLLILLITFYFGLRFKGYRPNNNVSWLDNEPGIRFDRFGIACAELDGSDMIDHSTHFSIELALESEERKTRGFDIIMSIHDGKDMDQLIIGQWNSYVVIMNGDDYSHKRGVKRISAEVFTPQNRKTHLTVVSGDDGVFLFINGRLAKTEKGFFLKVPHEERTILTMGNSVYGNNSWTGNIYGLGLYNYAFSPEAVKRHYNSWMETNSFLPLKDNPYLVFAFNESMRTTVPDAVAGKIRLNIPTFFTILKKRPLAPPWEGFSLDKNNMKDMIINLLGFIPLGFVVCWFIADIRLMSQSNYLLFTLFFCFLISLIIEITQAWIPSRSSQFLDLVLNTIGGLIGAYGARGLLCNRKNA